MIAQEPAGQEAQTHHPTAVAVEDRRDQLVDLISAGSKLDRDDLIDWVRSTEPLADTETVNRIVDRLTGRAEGLGAIDSLLVDPTVTEVMINGPGPVWLDRGHTLEPTDLELDEPDIGVLLERILDPLGLRVDRSSPMVDARLPDGSRVNAVVPPLALDGPIVTIRRFATEAVTLEAFGDADLIDLLRQLIDDRATMLVVGSTAAGKTTLLNAIGGVLHPDERVVTIEDTAELRLPGRHVVRLEARPPNSEGIGEVTMRQLVRNALRMRPDRLVIGEVRGPEALDLVLALNTGHQGSLATCHASSPGGALRRLATLSLLGAADLPPLAVNEQVHGAFDVIVHVARVGSARRIVTVATVPDDPDRPPVSLWSHPNR
ncbi:MAG: CpaF family protein [Acidimicrobiales bacterium]